MDRGFVKIIITLCLVSLAFAVIFGLWLRGQVKEQKTNCPICDEIGILFYKRVDTGEILGCDYCVTKGAIYDGENKTN